MFSFFAANYSTTHILFTFFQHFFRVRLSKRRQKPGQAPSNTRLVIKHRPINEIEYKMQRYREKQLEQPGDDEEEEEPELEPETVTITRTGEKAKTSGKIKLFIPKDSPIIIVVHAFV